MNQLNSDPTNTKVIAEAKIHVEASSHEKWSTRMRNQYCTGTTPLHYLMSALAKNSKNTALLEIASIAAKKADPIAWGEQRLRRGERHGITPLHYFMSALAKNPENTELINITGIAADKVDRSAWSMVDSTGDTPLRQLMIALAKKPENEHLVKIADIVANKVGPSEWLKGCWLAPDKRVHDPRFTFDTPLSNLIAAFSSATTGTSRKKIAIIWLVLLSKLNTTHQEKWNTVSGIQKEEFARNKLFLYGILKSDECPVNPSYAKNTHTLLGYQFLHRNLWDSFTSDDDLIRKIDKAWKEQQQAAQPQTLELASL